MTRKLKKKMELVMGAICGAHPVGVTTPQIIDLLYGDREDGGPIGASEQVWKLIKRMRNSGYPIEHGGKVRGYRLEAAS